MTDYAREVLGEEEQEPSPLLRAGREPVPAPERAADRRAAPRPRPPAAPAVPVPTRPDRSRPHAGPRDGAARGARREPVSDVPPDARRALALRAAVQSLSTTPDEAVVSALLTAYADAPAAEVERAARAVVAVYLRVPAARRRPVRAAVAPVLHREARTPLAARLAVRLAGGGFLVPSPPPGPEPQPEPDD